MSKIIANAHFFKHCNYPLGAIKVMLQFFFKKKEGLNESVEQELEEKEVVHL